VEHLIPVPIQWQSGLFRNTWDASKCDPPGSFSFYKFSLKNIPRDLARTGSEEAFTRYLFYGDFKDWWLSISGGGGTPPDKVFQIACVDGGWDLPWELMVRSLSSWKLRATAALARTTSGPNVFSPSKFDEPLRILMLHGDAMEGTIHRLDLAREKAIISQAWESLEFSVKECVEKPIIAEVTRENLVGLLAKWRPHVLWFSGHGRSRPNAALLFGGGQSTSDKQWIGAADFAQLIRRSGHQLLYSVILACNTGRKSDGIVTTGGFPELFVELSQIGVLSMLFMQAPIEDRNAIPLARDLFRYLVQGLPLESATARARATLLQRSTSKNQIDWAMPVVWSNAKGSLKLEWKRNSQTSAEFQINGRLMLRLLQPGTATLVEGDLANATSIAKTWTQHRRIWIKIDASSSIQTGISQFQVASTEITLKWLSSLCELQKSCSDFVIPINLSESDPATALKKWADDTYARLLPGDLPHEIAAILSCVGENQTFWWQRLCELKGICLAILSPPTNLKVPEWFWRPLLDAGNNPRIIMLSASLPTGEVDAGWLFDTLENIGDTDTMTEYLSSNAARVVAILDFPVQAFYLSKYQIECDALKSLRGVLIDTDAGPIMTASARRFVFEHMKAEEKLETHLRCIEILSDPELPAKSEWFEERLKHLLAARGESNKSVDASPLASYDQLGMSALKEAAVLCHGYYQEDRPHAIIDVFARLSELGPLRMKLPKTALLRVAWAYVRLGKTGQAESVLDRCDGITDLLEEAWRYALLAEIHKSQAEEAQRGKVLEEINEAVKLSQKAIAIADSPSGRNLALRRYYAYRQDCARIKHYLFYRREEAAKEYDEILTDLRDHPEIRYEVAIVKRNLAECLRTLSDSPADNRWARAAALLNEAVDELVQEGRRGGLLSEIYYELARMAESEGRDADGKRWLEDCKKSALNNRYFMMKAIADSRLFWKHQNGGLTLLSLEEWRNIDALLVAFPRHGWAVRVCIDGRLRAAHFYEANEDFGTAIQVVNSAKQLLNTHPAFTEGSDRERIARTYAGLHVLSKIAGNPNPFWSDFIGNYSWAREWLTSRETKEPDQIWSKS